MIRKIIFADWDDPDIIQLEDEFSPSTFWVKLSLGYNNYQLFKDEKKWYIVFQNMQISSDEIEQAMVVFRRWKTSPPQPIVSACNINSKAEISFIERQWEATFISLLYSSWEKNKQNWSRCPMLSLNKIDYYRILKNAVDIPEYWVSQSISAIGNEKSYDYVFKAIHPDQSFGKNKRVSTIHVTNDDSLQPCPSIFQKMITSFSEWRIGYFFGEVAMVSVESNTEKAPIDIRYASSVTRKKTYSKEIEREVRIVAKKLSLNSFTADILFDKERKHWWCDINPDGLFLVLDDLKSQPFKKLLTNFL
jgi:hypothetical protein